MAWDIIQSASESTDEETREYNHVYNWRTYIRPKKKRNRPEEDVVQKKKKKKNNYDNYYYDCITKKQRKHRIYNTTWRGVVFSEEEEKKRREEIKKEFWWRYRHCGGDSIDKVRTLTQMSKQLLLKGIQHEEMSEYELVSNLAGTTATRAAMEHGTVVRAILALQSS